jgi:threonylcarbamoyladenosine tRNA methylthiotransferase MtaB
LVEIVSRKLALQASPGPAVEQPTTGLLERGRQRAFIKVQDGCRYRCTFCIVTLARGAERSRPVGEIVDEINRLHAEGIQEVVLTGVHLGGYGSDQGHNLHGLIQRLLAETDLPRLRVGSLEPWDLPEGFWTLFENPRFMPHLHLPLQSGADSVLRRMARRCRSADYRRLIEQARSQVADFNVTTDIIVGFPGETEQEWRQTLEFVEQIGFSHLHIFAYSPRQGTKAAQLPDPVSRELKRERSETLHALGQRMKQQILERQLGRTLPVLVEGSGETGWSGYTPNYLRVGITVPAGLNLSNRIVEIELTGLNVNGDQLSGRVAVKDPVP